MAIRSVLLAAATVSILLLSGCVSADPGPTTELSLVETKSPVQLLRNDATDRVEKELVSDIRKTTDQSFPCFNEEDNPGGLIRQWKSSAELVLVGGTDRVGTSETLVQTYVDQGWKAEEVSEDSSFGLTLLSKESSLASIEVSSADMSAVSIIRITATGPCVTTGGPDSDEVLDLE